MGNRSYISLILLVFLGSCQPSAPPAKESLTGENSQGTRLLDTWPREGPELLWKYEGLGKGYGSPAISREGIFVNGEEEGMSYIAALDHQGTFRWRCPNGTEFVGADFAASYPGTRSAPTVKGHEVYAISGTGHAVSYTHLRAHET